MASAQASLLVRAVRLGFYPDPGDFRAKAREPGAVFKLRCAEEYAGIDRSEHGWMEWADAPVSAKAVADIPPTTVPRIVQNPLGIAAGGNPAQSVAPAGPEIPGVVPMGGWPTPTVPPLADTPAPDPLAL